MIGNSLKRKAYRFKHFIEFLYINTLKNPLSFSTEMLMKVGKKIRRNLSKIKNRCSKRRNVRRREHFLV